MILSFKKGLISYCFLFMCFQLEAVELKSYFSLNNFHFDDDNEIVSSDYDFEYGEIVTGEISDNLFLDSGFTKSIISDYSIFTDFRITKDLFGFNLGIFTNFLNDSSKILTPGLNYGLDFTFPGIILLSLDMNNTIPNTSALENGVNINNYKIKVGFYLGETILSANLESETNTKGTILTSTSTINNKYFLNMDLFNKYSKYRISIDLGWNALSRTVTSLTTVDDVLTGETTSDIQAGTAYFNSDFTILISDNITLDLGVLLHLIKFPIQEIDTIETDEFSWGMSTALIINL